MIHRSWFGVALASLASCSSSYAPQHFGTATAEMQQAFKDWCAHGRLESETKLEGPARTASANPNLLVMDCYNNGGEPSEHGWLAIDSKTNELLELVVTVHESTADALLQHTLSPALDEKQRSALTDMLAWARSKPKDVSKRFDAGRLSLVIQVYPREAAPEWFVAARAK